MAGKLVRKSRAQNAIQKEDPDGNHDVLRMSIWAPQLVALHHPFITEPKLCPSTLDAELKSGVADWNTSLGDIMGANFCLTANIVHHEFIDDEAIDDPFFERLEKDWIELSRSSDATEEIPITAILSCSLIRSFFLTPLRAVLPWSPKIPFSSFMGERLLLPFSRLFFRAPEESYLKAMTSKSFLEDDEWVGFIGQTTRLDDPGWGGPLVDIRFKASIHQPESRPGVSPGEHITESSSDAECSSNELEILDVEASGVLVEDLETDSRSEFQLTGQVRSTGRIDIDMIFPSEAHQSNEWSSWMTPFGMVGFWDSTMLKLDPCGYGRRHGLTKDDFAHR